MIEFTEVETGPGVARALVSGAPFVETLLGVSSVQFSPETIAVSYADGQARSHVHGTHNGRLIGQGWFSSNDNDLTSHAAPLWVQRFVREHAEAAGTWVIPAIPHQAHGFRVRRTLSSEHTQPYKPVAADISTPHDDIKRVMHFGQNAVATILDKAFKFGAIGPPPKDILNQGLPYGLLEVLDDTGTPIESLVFAIPSQDGFVWWSSRLGLEPVEMMWTTAFPEDVTVLLPLTVEQAGELYHLASHTLHSVKRVRGVDGEEGDDRPARAALDTLHRLRELARHERAQRIQRGQS